ncbi:hypothetical protein DL764_006170 [Monosporascus ibericus]|uniref:Ecp2 effector protein domain-containing protein n=1 Tax=Monosporascus ibericus TaxID=155417 RepID=A0A4Q4T5K4_9PEZI|nr:hypothetical protein DL764_006170 [Monosporascus ibericus]
MRFPIITGMAALLVASGCSAFVVSEDQPDGLYSVHVNGNRSEHILLREYNETETSDFDSNSILNRASLPDVLVACEVNIWLDDVNEKQAASKFGIECDKGHGIGRKSRIYVKFGSVITFACSWGGPQACSSQEYTDAMNILDKKCGYLVAGFVQMNDWKKIYGRTTVGEETCGGGWD